AKCSRDHACPGNERSLSATAARARSAAGSAPPNVDRAQLDGAEARPPRASVTRRATSASARAARARGVPMMIDMKVPFIAAALLAPASFAGTTLAAEPTAAVRPAQITAEPPEGAPPAVEDEPAKETWWRPERHPPARFAVAVNPLGLLLGMFLAEFDYGLDERMS